MYELVYSDLSLKQLKKLDKEIQKRIISTIERCRIRPQHHLQRLVDMPYYKLRVGDYRIIIDLKEDKLMIFVVEMGHRKNIYN